MSEARVAMDVDRRFRELTGERLSRRELMAVQAIVGALVGEMRTEVQQHVGRCHRRRLVAIGELVSLSDLADARCFAGALNDDAAGRLAQALVERVGIDAVRVQVGATIHEEQVAPAQE